MTRLYDPIPKKNNDKLHQVVASFSVSSAGCDVKAEKPGAMAAPFLGDVTPAVM